MCSHPRLWGTSRVLLALKFAYVHIASVKVGFDCHNFSVLTFLMYWTAAFFLSSSACIVWLSKSVLRSRKYCSISSRCFSLKLGSAHSCQARRSVNTILLLLGGAGCAAETGWVARVAGMCWANCTGWFAVLGVLVVWTGEWRKSDLVPVVWSTNLHLSG